jgi:hypothetical protein
MDRQQLIDKYGIDNPPQADNEIDLSIQEVERTMARATDTYPSRTGDTAWLFDPNWSPAMWGLANKTMGNMRTRFAHHIAKAADTDVFLYYAGTQDFYVYSRNIERFAYMLSFCWPVGCDIKMAPGGCSGVELFLPLQRGQFIVVFGICEACDVWARVAAETNFRACVMEAQAMLPPGARIDPGSALPPAP